MSVKRPLAVAWLIPVMLALCVGGCSERGAGFVFAPRALPEPAPVPASPAGVLWLFQWTYNNKAISRCGELFTADYHFYFSPLDSAGVAYRDVPWDRDDELISTTHLFVGGNLTQPPASTIQLALDRNFFVYPEPSIWDPEGRWHKSIRTQVFLSVRTVDGSAFEVSGTVDFHLVRGDSAMIPDDLVARGFRPDSSRWWISRWDDETAELEATPYRSGGREGVDVARQAPILATQPISKRTWGALKVLYR